MFFLSLPWRHSPNPQIQTLAHLLIDDGSNKCSNDIDSFKYLLQEKSNQSDVQTSTLTVKPAEEKTEKKIIQIYWLKLYQGKK